MNFGESVAEFATIVAPFAPAVGVSCGFLRAPCLPEGLGGVPHPIPKETTPCTIPA